MAMQSKSKGANKGKSAKTPMKKQISKAPRKGVSSKRVSAKIDDFVYVRLSPHSVIPGVQRRTVIAKLREKKAKVEFVRMILTKSGGGQKFGGPWFLENHSKTGKLVLDAPGDSLSTVFELDDLELCGEDGDPLDAVFTLDVWFYFRR